MDKDKVMLADKDQVPTTTPTIPTTTTTIIKRGENSTRERGRRCSISSYDKSQVKCYNCDKLWYYATECRAPKKKVDERINQIEDGTLLLAYKENERGEDNT